MKTSFAIAAAAAAGLSFVQPALGQSLGTVHFETACKPEAQKLFDSGMLYQQSFWYRAQPVMESSRAAARQEPRRGRCRDRNGEERRRQDPARARLPRCARRHV